MKNLYLYLGALVLAVNVGTALAQRPGGNGPLPGDPTYGGGGGQYAPPPAPPQPTGEWIKTWGAIAISNNGSGKAGAVVGKLSKNAAQDEAIASCEKLAIGSCVISAYYENQCVAMAARAEGYGRSTSAVALSIESASDNAIYRCIGANGGAACKVIYSACTDPIFRSY